MHKILKSLVHIAIFLATTNVSAVPITITGQGASDGLWDVTAHHCDRTTAQCLTTLSAQEWNGDRALALVFARETGLSLGYLNHPTDPG